MYRRVNSGRFIGLTTFGIVVVMAVFTWVMYGMAQQVFTMTAIMIDLSDSFKAMIDIQVNMAADMNAMSGNIAAMSSNVASMSGDFSAMSGDVGAINRNVGDMSGAVVGMTDAMRSMAVNLNRMTYDVGQATYALSNPLSYMWGNSFPF